MPTDFIQHIISRLSGTVTAAGIQQADFEATVLQLTGHARRLFIRLYAVDEATTTQLRQECAIGNISEAATLLNRRLAAAGDNRRVLCTNIESIRNRFNDYGRMGHWRLVNMAETGESEAA